MKVFLKVLLSLFLVYSMINVGSCDDTETIELSCISDDDCKSFSDKFVSSSCNSTKTCDCFVRQSNEPVKCTPKITKVSNTANETPCTYQNTELKNGTCITKVVSLGRSCDDSMQCFKNDRNSECLKGICECKENFTEVGKVCRSNVEPEKNCSENIHCIENAVCHEEKCVCNKNFISSSNFTKCLPFVAYKDKCSENRQCEMMLGHGAICNDNICVCNQNYTAFMNDKKEFECQKKKKEGDSCNNDSDCSDEDFPIMSCKEQKCRCANDYELVQLNGENICAKQTISSLPPTSGATSLLISKLLYLVGSIACLIVNVL